MTIRHKVSETKMRSLFKGITSQVLEFTVDTLVLNFIFPNRIPESIGIAFLFQVVCFIIGYLNERGWNKVQWGRKLKVYKRKIKDCHSCIWRHYYGSLMMCDHPVTREKMKHRTNVLTPCHYYKYDKTGRKYLELIKLMQKMPQYPNREMEEIS